MVTSARAMRAFEPEDDGERLLLVLLHVFDGEVGGHIVYPTLRWRGSAVDFKRAILIAAVRDVACRVVEARTLAALIAHVPFADVGGLVSGGAQKRCVRDRVGGKRRVVVGDAVEVMEPKSLRKEIRKIYLAALKYYS